MFEKASRLKLRFNYKGLCSVEDLWDLPLGALDNIFKGMNAQKKTQNEESLLETKSEANTSLDLGIEIVKHIVAIRLAEKQAREDVVAKAERKQKLLEIIAEKQDEALKGMSVEDLTKLVNES